MGKYVDKQEQTPMQAAIVKRIYLAEGEASVLVRMGLRVRLDFGPGWVALSEDNEPQVFKALGDFRGVLPPHTPATDGPDGG